MSHISVEDEDNNNSTHANSENVSLERQRWNKSLAAFYKNKSA